MTQTTNNQAQRQSVQMLPDVQREGASGIVGGFWQESLQRGALLPAWGTRAREKALRAYYRNEFSTLVQGAFMGLTKKVKATSWELKGGRNTTASWQRLFRKAHFNKGWGYFLSLVILDYLRFDGGAYVEVIAPGNPLKAPTGRVSGLAHLDSYHCLPTGDPDYPVVYHDRKGGLHILHHTRVLHFVDMPDGDQDNPGYGLCALSRAIAVVERQLLMGRYTVAKLDDKPPPGMLLVGGMTKVAWDAAWSRYKQEQRTDERPEWGAVLPIFGADASLTPKIESVGFSVPPEKYDYKVYVELDVHELALALGVDIQELWELTTGGIGSAGQSEIQHAKSQGRAYGDILTMTERAFNDVLPESLEFAYKVRDPYEAQQQAVTAQGWAGFTQAVGDSLTADEKRQILANQVEAVADAVLDGNGELIRLNDADPQEGQVLTVDSAPSPTGNEPLAIQVTTPDSTQKAAKDIQSTRLDFEGAASALFDGAASDDVTRRRFGVILRDLVRLYGDRAFRDGLQAGGVEGDLDAEDKVTYAVLLATQSAYVTGLGNALFNEGASVGDSAAKASLWWSKSVSPFFEAGRLSADRNGLYEWVLGQTEHCPDCLSMSGQKHRMREYAQKGITPRADRLACGGFNCQCNLVKTTGRSKGAWL